MAEFRFMDDSFEEIHVKMEIAYQILRVAENISNVDLTLDKIENRLVTLNHTLERICKAIEDLP